MMMRRFWVLTVLLPVLSLVAYAQDDFFHPELDWRTIETEHFSVHYHTGAERTARVVAKVAEDIYEPVTSLYHHKPDGKVNFVIKDVDDYSNGGAYFFDNKIEIWASALDFDLRGTHNWLRNVVTHEFTHIVQIQTSLKFGRKVPALYFQWLQYESERRTDVLYGFPNGIVSYPFSGYVVPSWFAEGVAQYNRKELGYDTWDSHRDMILRMYALDSTLLSWNEMAVFGKTSLGNESSYNAGFSIVRYIGQHYGDDKLEEISRNLSSLTAVTIDGAIEKAIGKSGSDLYDEWKNALMKDYAERTAGMRSSLAQGEIVGGIGFGNFYPTFSPDGKAFAYVSNKHADYFGLSSLYLYDMPTKKEKMLKSGVRSTLSWSPDGTKLFYSKLSRDNSHWSNLFDVYVYDISRDEEKRLTFGARANSPAISPDGKTVVYVAGSDGTLNLFAMNSDGSNIRQLTKYANGEQVYNPKWSPDGSTVIFDYSFLDGRDIATVPAAGGEVTMLLATPDDERNAVYTPDGTHIIYASDKTGVFNIYQYDLHSKESEQLTNVLGGAFMPSVNASGSLAFATYTSSGYKIALIDSMRSLSHPVPYLRNSGNESADTAALASAKSAAPTQQFDWASLRSYDDTKLVPLRDTTYKTVATDLTFVPLLRVDNYNPRNKGIDEVKLGLFAFSYDMLDQYGFNLGAAINKGGERDLFLSFDYRGKIPGLFQLGLEPALSFEAYNITRNADSFVALPTDTIGVGVWYNFLEFDLALKQKIINEATDLEIRYAHSRYTASIDAFSLPATGQLVPAFSELYLIGNDLSLTLNIEALVPSRTSEINPVGRKIRVRYDYEANKFNPTGQYAVDPASGLLLPEYEQINMHRLELSWRESQELPGWTHTLSGQLRGGTIFGPPVDDFFDFYIGGLEGMKGYPFYSLGGNEYVYGNLTYRFPVDEHLDFRVLQLYFDKLYAAFYGDVGDAWSGGGLEGRNYKRDAGVELRLEAFSYYAFPTRIFFNATYGFDQFTHYVQSTNTTVTYGKDWNFHFGVLFGFDLD